MVNTSPDIKKNLDEQLNRLAQKYRIASAEAVEKLTINFEATKVESSVFALTEGKAPDELIEDITARYTNFCNL